MGLASFDGALLTLVLTWLGPRDWAVFRRCASWCDRAADADYLWEIAACDTYGLSPAIRPAAARDNHAAARDGQWKRLVASLFAHHPPTLTHVLPAASAPLLVGTWRSVCSVATAASAAPQPTVHFPPLAALAEQLHRSAAATHQSVSSASKGPMRLCVTTFVIAVHQQQQQHQHHRVTHLDLVQRHINRVAGFRDDTRLIEPNASLVGGLYICDVFPVAADPSSSSPSTSVVHVFMLLVLNGGDASSSGPLAASAATAPAAMTATVAPPDSETPRAAHDTMRQLLELAYCMSSDVVVFHERDNDDEAAVEEEEEQHHGVAVVALGDPVAQAVVAPSPRRPTILDTLFTAAAATSHPPLALPEWTIARHFPATTVVCLGDDVSPSCASPALVVGDDDILAFARDRLRARDSASVAMFLGTRSREVRVVDVARSGVVDVAAKALTMSPLGSAPFRVSWALAPGLVASHQRTSAHYCDPGYAPTLVEYVLIVASLAHSMRAHQQQQQQQQHLPSSTRAPWAPSPHHWDAPLVLALMRPSLTRVLETFARQMAEDDGGRDDDDGVAAVRAGDEARGGGAREQDDIVELLPDLEAHRALAAMSDASETASSTGELGGDDVADEDDDDPVARRWLAAFHEAEADVDADVINNFNGGGERAVSLGDGGSDDISDSDAAELSLARAQRHSASTTPAAPSTAPAAPRRHNNNGAASTSVTSGSAAAAADDDDDHRSNDDDGPARHHQRRQPQHDHHHHLERVRGRCSALPRDAAVRVPLHASEFWAAFARHAQVAFEILVEVARPYCTCDCALAVCDALRDALDEATRRLWAAYAEQSEQYCAQLVASVTHHLRFNYGSPAVFEFRRERQALKRWYASAHDKIEEYLLKARGPRRLPVLAAFVAGTLLPEFVAACEADLRRHESMPAPTTATAAGGSPGRDEDDHPAVNNDDDDDDDEVDGDGAAVAAAGGGATHRSRGQHRLLRTERRKFIHPADARQACTFLQREVDGMLQRCDRAALLNDPGRVEYVRVARGIALNFGADVDAVIVARAAMPCVGDETIAFGRVLLRRVRGVTPEAEDAAEAGAVAAAASLAPPPPRQQQQQLQHVPVVAQPPANQSLLQSAVSLLSSFLQ